jgi:hypothetical protein
MVLNSQKTIYGLHLNLAKMLNLPYVISDNTTLNEKFQIANNETLANNEYTSIKYYTIGNGGVNIINNGNGYSYSEHSPVDAALFNHIPWIMREINNDVII